MTHETVAVIGLGNMGSALARQLAAGPWPLTVWNRSPARSEPFRNAPTKVARSAEEAIGAASLIIFNVATCDDLTAILNEHRAVLSGKALLNLVTGSPAEIRKIEALTSTLGAELLSGTIMCFPADIGTPQGIMMLAGSPHLWEAWQALVLHLAPASLYLGENAAKPNIMDTALTGCLFGSAMSGFLEAAAYARREGVAIEELAAFVPGALAATQHQMEIAAQHIASGDYATNQAGMISYAQSNLMFRQALADAGQADTMLSAFGSRLWAAVEAGAQDDALARLIDF